MLRPTRIYVRTVLDLVKRFPISAMANVTGGGIAGNLVRVLPRGVHARVRYGSWPVPAVFKEIARRGPVEFDEMMRVFNMGIGYIIVAPPRAAPRIAARCRRLRQACHVIGSIDAAARKTSPPEVSITRGSRSRAGVLDPI